MTLKRNTATGVLLNSLDFPNTMYASSLQSTFRLYCPKHSTKCYLRDTMTPDLSMRKLRVRDPK